MASGPPEPPEPGPCCLAPGAAAGGLAGTPGRMRCARPKSPAMQGWEGGRERGRTVGTDGARRTKFDDPVLGDEEIRRLEIAVAHTCRRRRRRAERSPLLGATGAKTSRGSGRGRTGQLRRAVAAGNPFGAHGSGRGGWRGGLRDCAPPGPPALPPAGSAESRPAPAPINFTTPRARATHGLLGEERGTLGPAPAASGCGRAPSGYKAPSRAPPPAEASHLSADAAAGGSRRLGR